MKKVKVKKQKSPVKADLVDAGRLMVNTIEHQSKDVTYKTEGWNKKFSQLTQSVEEIEKALKNQIALKPTELNQQYLEVNATLLKLTKEIETTEKRFHTSKITVNEKLVEPLKGPLNPHNQANLENIKTIIKGIETTLESDQKALNEISSKFQGLTVRLIALEGAVNKFCLSDRVEEAVKLSAKFTKCVESICRDMSDLDLAAASTVSQSNPNESPQSLLLFSIQKVQENMQSLGKFKNNLALPNLPKDKPQNGTVAVALI